MKRAFAENSVARKATLASLVLAALAADAFWAQERPAPRAAAEACGEVTSETGSGELLKAADCLRGHGKYRESIAVYERFLTKEPGGSPGLFMGMGMAWEALNEDGKALPCFEKAVTMNPKDRDAQYHLGLAQEGMLDYESAMRSFRRVLELHPGDGDAYRNIGFIHLENEEYDPGIEALKQAITSNPKDAKAHHNLSIAYDKKLQSLLDESMIIQRGFVPGKAYSFDDPGQLRVEAISADLQRNDYFGMAIAEAKEETNLSPADPVAWYSLGTTYLRNTRKYGKEALAALEEALIPS